MKPMSLWRSLVITAVALAAMSAPAAPVNFAVTPTAFTPGAGYGVDFNEASGTLLDVSFSATGAQATATLNNVGDSFDLTFGTITFNESGLIRSQETDDLDVTATFTFADPLVGVRSVVATGTASVGVIVDALVDYSISWNDVEVGFGNGGLFRISMAASNFRQSGAQRDQTATVTLLTAPTVNTVPEPASVALVGLALAGMTAWRRRRA